LHCASEVTTVWRYRNLIILLLLLLLLLLVKSQKVEVLKINT